MDIGVHASHAQLKKPWIGKEKTLLMSESIENDTTIKTKNIACGFIGKRNTAFLKSNIKRWLKNKIMNALFALVMAL